MGAELRDFKIEGQTETNRSPDKGKAQWQRISTRNKWYPLNYWQSSLKQNIRWDPTPAKALSTHEQQVTIKTQEQYCHGLIKPKPNAVVKGELAEDVETWEIGAIATKILVSHPNEPK